MQDSKSMILYKGNVMKIITRIEKRWLTISPSSERDPE